jgi:hypothetical protein
MGRTTGRVERNPETGKATLDGVVKDDAGRVLYFARRYFGYAGQELERGEVVGLTGLRNDARLVELGYVRALQPSDVALPCRVCAKRFIDHDSREHHGRKAHEADQDGANVPFSPRGATVDDTASDVQRLERQQLEDDSRAPLDLDKTIANRARV